MTQSIEIKTTGKTDQVALRGVRVHAVLRAMSLRALVEQTFVNRGQQAVEAVYTFPLPDGAAVCGFEVVTGDRVLTGQVEESEKAISLYEKAIGDGDGAFSLEQVRPDVFSVRVGNLKPKQAATIRLRYVKELEVVDRGIRLAIPTTVAPRYISQAGMDPLEAAIAGDELNPPHVLDVPYGLTLEMEIDLGMPLKSVTCPSHAIQTQEVGSHRWQVSFAGGIEQMDRDVVLQLELERAQQPAVQRGSGPGGSQFLAVSFVPEFPEQDLLRQPEPTETIFLIDCSGSMQGSSIEQARTALELCLRSLNRGDSFNICRFGSSYEFFSPEPVIYDDQTLAQAVRYLREMDADLGGTELHEALNAVLRPQPRVGSVRQVIVLTDGEVSNEPAVIKLAKRHHTHNRIFSFGIGSASSGALINGLARCSGGASEFITEGERIEEKVLRTFGRIASPRVSDIEVDWGKAGVVTQCPSTVPAVFDGDAVTVFARVAGELPATVSLKCRTAEGPRSWQVTVPPLGEEGALIATVWARRALAEGESLGWSRKELVALSKEFGVLCEATTFLAIEHRSLEERNEGRPELQRVPVLLAAGYGGSPVTTGLDMLADAASVVPCFGLRMPSAKKSMARMMTPRSGLSGFIAKSVDRWLPSPPKDALVAVLSWQSSEGWFDVPAKLDDLVPQERTLFEALRDEYQRKAAELSAGGGIDPHLPDTLAVLAFLRRHFADRQQLWQRAASKAARWLRKNSGLTDAIVKSLLEG